MSLVEKTNKEELVHDGKLLAMLGEDNREERNKQFIELLCKVREMYDTDESMEDIISYVYSLSGVKVSEPDVCGLMYSYDLLSAWKN